MCAFTPRLHQRRVRQAVSSPHWNPAKPDLAEAQVHTRLPLLQCCVERTLVVQDVKAFMDLKHQENSEKTSIASVIASHKAHIASYKAHLATLEANTASTLEKMGVAAASMQSHQAPGEQPWPQQSPSLDASTICCTAVVDENECRCRGGR